MKIKGLSKEQLKKKLNCIEKRDPSSRWVKYILYHLRKMG